MEGVDHILNWKLNAGSHRFLGSEGSTRIAEAALVAMGFESQPIVHIWQSTVTVTRWSKATRGVVRCRVGHHTHRAAAGTSPRAVRPAETDWALWRK